MNLPSILKWSAGDQPDADLFNRISYALDFAMAPPQAWVVKTGTAQAIPAVTWTPVNLTTIVMDTGAAAGDDPVWTVASPSRLYARTPGWYDIEANLHWASNTDSTRRLMGVAHTSVDAVTRTKSRIDVLAKGDMKQRLFTTWFLNAGDWIEIQAFTNTAQSLAADQGQNSLRTGLKMRWFSM